jgi:hypothetical protein
MWSRTGGFPRRTGRRVRARVVAVPLVRRIRLHAEEVTGSNPESPTRDPEAGSLGTGFSAAVLRPRTRRRLLAPASLTALGAPTHPSWPLLRRGGCICAAQPPAGRLEPPGGAVGVHLARPSGQRSRTGATHRRSTLLARPETGCLFGDRARQSGPTVAGCQTRPELPPQRLAMPTNKSVRLADGWAPVNGGGERLFGGVLLLEPRGGVVVVLRKVAGCKGALA